MKKLHNPRLKPRRTNKGIVYEDDSLKTSAQVRGGLSSNQLNVCGGCDNLRVVVDCGTTPTQPVSTDYNCCGGCDNLRVVVDCGGTSTVNTPVSD